MDEQRKRILEMLQDGKINADQAEKLLDALGTTKREEVQTTPEPSAPPEQSMSPGTPNNNFGQNLAAKIQGLVSGVMNAVGLPGAGGGRSHYGDMIMTRATLEGMQDGSSLTLFGDLTIADDVPEDLLRRKLGNLVHFGDTVGPEHLLGAIQGCTSQNFGDFKVRGSEQNDDTRAIQNHGDMTLTRYYLENLPDGSTIENYGEIVIAPDVPADLIRQKVGDYINHGDTTGPSELLGVLQSRCSQNHGEFSEI